MKKFIITFIIFCFITQITFSQSNAGDFSIGMRSTFSMFDHDNEAKLGYGTGGQLRIHFKERLNTEWFIDYIQQDLGSTAFRKDIHIGWSLMFYPWLIKDRTKLQRVKPYFVAGHCFDWSELVLKDYRKIKGRKFGSAVQFGMGTHMFLSKKLDLTLLSQYMVHLGKDVKVTFQESTHTHEILKEKHTNAYGHLLLTIGINYKIAKLWKSKK